MNYYSGKREILAVLVWGATNCQLFSGKTVMFLYFYLISRALARLLLSGVSFHFGAVALKMWRQLLWAWIYCVILW